VDGAANDRLGWSVSISGDSVVCGAPAKTVGGNTGQGAAYVFVRTGTSWVQQARFTAPDGAANDWFGTSVSLSGDAAVVGADRKAVGGHSYQGAAYAFARSGTSWSTAVGLTAPDGAAMDQLGCSVSVSGDTAIIGALGKTVGGHGGQGAVYFFVRNGASWPLQAEVTASDGAANDGFGASVSVSGDTAVVGAPQKAVGGYAGQGAAYVLVRSGTSWAQQALLTSSAMDGAASDDFGGSVSISVSGEVAVVGAPNKLVGGNPGQGAAYEFVRSGTTWSPQAELFALDGAAFDGYGNAVSVSGNTAAVGAHFKAVGMNNHQGMAYLFVVGKEDGDACASDSECLHGHCVDLVCCATDCAGLCQACAAALKAGGPDGVCGYALASSDPHDECTADPVATCLLDGNCDGNGACARYAAGTECVAGSCLSLTTGNLAHLCDGIGTCVEHGVATCQVGYACNAGACQTTCTSGSDCASGYRCDAGGHCVALFVDGVACAQGLQCQSGFCADQVCCNSPCGNGNPDDCQACSGAAGGTVDGTCSPSTGNACSDGNACTRTDTCQAGACTGANPVVCPAPDQCHSAGSCDPATGACSNPAKGDGATCSDSNACTLVDTCTGGACMGSSPVTCAAQDECHTAGTCDAATGACSNPAKGDGSPCSGGACQAGTCVQAGPDAGTAGVDAAVVTPGDGAIETFDATVAGFDATGGIPDTTVVESDAAVAAGDASTGLADATAAGSDAGAASADAATSIHADTGGGGAASTGCGCATTGSGSAATSPLGLGLLVLLLRRRQGPGDRRRTPGRLRVE
jgi:MYXO-CTERM domain-containing protein